MLGGKIEGLLSRVVELENRFDSRPSDVAEQRRRDVLRRYVAVFPLGSFGAQSFSEILNASKRNCDP